MPVNLLLELLMGVLLTLSAIVTVAVLWPGPRPPRPPSAFEPPPRHGPGAPEATASRGAQDREDPPGGGWSSAMARSGRSRPIRGSARARSSCATAR